VQYVYRAAGAYTVTLTATNACGEEVVRGALVVPPMWRIYLPLLHKSWISS